MKSTVMEKYGLVGYGKIGQDYGDVIVATFYNPNTEDLKSVIVFDIDRPYMDKPELSHMSIDDALLRVYNRKRGIIQEGDTVVVYKGRKIPVGTVAVVKELRPWHDRYGHWKCTYAVFTDGRKTNVENCRLV